MNNNQSIFKTNSSLVYEIRIKGELCHDWADWFGGLTIVVKDENETVVKGPVVDQSALLGIVRKIRDLGMTLISINQVLP